MASNHNYLVWNEQTIDSTNKAAVNAAYNSGYVFTRKAPGLMNQTRSLRIRLADFELSSENRRILRKAEDIELQTASLPMPDYHWEIGKLGKEFYAEKFGDGTFSANKIKELLTSDESNFNVLLQFVPLLTNEKPGEVVHESTPSNSPLVRGRTVPLPAKERLGEVLGYTICHKTHSLLHYSYPFYDLEQSPKSMGLAMMTKAIVWAKEQGLEYVYLGSFQRPSDTYKLQFKGMEWFDGEKWQSDLEGLEKPKMTENQIDLFTYSGILFFTPNKLRDYLNQKNVNGNFGSTLDQECVVALHLRKVYELFFKNKNEIVIGFELRLGGEEKIELLPDDFDSVEHSMEKITQTDTLSDIIIGGFNGEDIYNAYKIQIKHFGVGNLKNANTDDFIEFLDKRLLDAANSEQLVIFLDGNRGNIDSEKVDKWAESNAQKIRYKQLITVHQSKLDNKMIFNLLISNGKHVKKQKVFSLQEMLQFDQPAP